MSHFKRVLKVRVKRKTNNPSASLPSSVTLVKYSFQAAKKKTEHFQRSGCLPALSEVSTAYSAATFPLKWGVFWHGSSGGHTKKWILSSLIQRNTQADPRPIPTRGRKPLSRYLTSGMCLSHGHSTGRMCLCVCGQGQGHFKVLAWGLTRTYTGRFGRGSSGVSCIRLSAYPQLSFS